jgi:hypothetical protein
MYCCLFLELQVTAVAPDLDYDDHQQGDACQYG